MTDLEIIAAMEAELKALNAEVAEIEQSVNALDDELVSMEKDYE
jgi:cell division protein FtsB